MVNSIIQKFFPILECFFIIYKIICGEQILELKRNESGLKKGIKIQGIIEEESIEDIPIPLEKSFSHMKTKKFDVDDLFFFICEKNKKVKK